MHRVWRMAFVIDPFHVMSLNVLLLLELHEEHTVK